jgi:hypothetical protein
MIKTKYVDNVLIIYKKKYYHLFIIELNWIELNCQIYLYIIIMYSFSVLLLAVVMRYQHALWVLKMWQLKYFNSYN